nr:hypothetical protein [Tanacetum cinerariifolium]
MKRPILYVYLTKPVDQEDQALLEELERLKRQEKEANDAAKTLRKTFAQSIEDLLLQAGTTRASSTNYIPSLEDNYKVSRDGIFTSASYDNEGAVADFTNLETTVNDVYVSQPPGFIDPKFLNKVYKVVKALYGLQQDPRAWYATLSTFLVQSRYRRGLIDKTLFIKKDKKDIMLVKQREDGIFISQDKYVAEILTKFDFMSVKTASTPIETTKSLWSRMKKLLMWMFQVTPKTSHLQVVKRIFRRLILGQCKNQTIVATSSIEAECEEDDRKYTLTKETLERMMALRLIVKSESEAA